MQRFSFIVAAIVLAGSTIAADKSGEFVEADIQKLDAGAKTAVVKTADGTEHTFRFAKSTTVHGADEAGSGAKDAFHGKKAATSPYITPRPALQRLPTKLTISGKTG